MNNESHMPVAVVGLLLGKQKHIVFGLDTLARRRDNAQCTFMSTLIVGEIDSPELLARVNINVPPNVYCNYRLIRTDLIRRAYSENDPMTAMARKFNQRYTLFDWHQPTKFC